MPLVSNWLLTLCLRFPTASLPVCVAIHPNPALVQSQTLPKASGDPQASLLKPLRFFKAALLQLHPLCPLSVGFSSSCLGLIKIPIKIPPLPDFHLSCPFFIQVTAFTTAARGTTRESGFLFGLPHIYIHLIQSWSVLNLIMISRDSDSAEMDLQYVMISVKMWWRI